MGQRYKKKPKTYAELANLLLNRGLVAETEHLITTLKNISYYRLSAYWFPFREDGSDKLQEGTSLNTILYRYCFDNELRLLLFSVIHSVEIALRNRIMHAHVMTHGSSGYKQKETFPKCSKGEHNTLLSKMYGDYLRSNETFAKHFKEKYGLYDDFPLWMACEMQTFGNVLAMYKGTDKDLKGELAEELQVSTKILQSWIYSINYVRNLCAHHNRVWNRRLALSPSIPRKRLPSKESNNLEWYEPIVVVQDPENVRIFVVMTIIKHILNRYTMTTGFEDDLFDLLKKYRDIPLNQMGFPEDWLECPIWLT